jgi:hypothetical protein
MGDPRVAAIQVRDVGEELIVEGYSPPESQARYFAA